MPNTPNLGLTMMAASQAQKEVVFNQAIIAFDALFKGSVIDVTLTAPPASPALGDAYIVAAGGSGAWSGKDQAVAVYFSGWQFFGPAPGQLLWSVTQAAYFLWKNATLGWQQVPAVAVTALSDMTDVGNAGSPTNGQLLGFSSTLGKWTPVTMTLGKLADVQVTEGAPIDGYALVWKQADAKWEAKALATVATSGSYNDLTDKPTLALSSMSDVHISSTPANGQALVYNANDGKWEPGTVSGGGGGAVAVQAAGSQVTAAATALNFVNATSVTNSNGVVTVTLPTGGAGGGGGGAGGGAYVRPSVVQSAAFAGGISSASLGNAPTPGNLLLVMLSHWSNGVAPPQGWTQAAYTAGGTNDGLMVAFKIATVADTATQQLFTESNTSGVTGALFEVSGANFTNPIVGISYYQDTPGTSQNVIGLSPINNTLALGYFGTTNGQELPTITASGVAPTLGPTVQVNTGSGAPRAASAFHADLGASNDTFTATWTASADSYGVVVTLMPSFGLDAGNTRYDLGMFMGGTMDNGETLVAHVAANAVTWPTGLVGSYAKAAVPPSSDTVLTMKKNTFTVGTITFRASETNGSFNLSGDLTFSIGDLFTLIAPATADNSLADVAITLAGTRA